MVVLMGVGRGFTLRKTRRHGKEEVAGAGHGGQNRIGA